MFKRLYALLLALLLPLAACADSLLAVPFPEDAPEYATAEAVGSLLNRQVVSLPGLNGAEAVNAMLENPDTLLLDTQSSLILSLEGYTVADCREAMRPVCRLGVQPLIAVLSRDFAQTRDIQDYEGFEAYLSDHEYDLFLARYVDAGVVDHASFLLENALPLLAETCFDQEEALDALVSDTIQLLVLPAPAVTDQMLPLFSLGSAPAGALPELPCAAGLNLPISEGITLSLYASASLSPEEAAALADQLSAADLAEPLSAAGYTPSFLSGEAFESETADAFAAYVSYMTSEGLFFYEQ